MKKDFIVLLSLALSLVACQAGPSSPASPTIAAEAVVETAAPAVPPTSEPLPTAVVFDSFSTTDLAELKAVVGDSLREPAFLPQGYVFERAEADGPTQSVCLQYRHAESGESVLLIAQGPAASATPLALIPGWPDYAIVNEPAAIGGAANSFHLSGYRRSAWACSAIAEATQPMYSFAMAPQFTWEVDQRQFDLYAANAGCGTPGGLTTLDLLRLAEGLTGNSTHAADELDPDCLHSIAEAEKLAGFDVKEPGFLPEYAAFYYATYEMTPGPTVVLRFFHVEHRDTGPFFSISQFTEAPPYFTTACDKTASSACEVLEIDGSPVVYLSSGQTEQLDGSVDGVYFSLFRNAGEPGKVYKDDLVQIVGGLK